MASKKDEKHEKVYFKVGDEVWRRVGHFYQKTTITAMDGEQVTLGKLEPDEAIKEAQAKIVETLKY